MFKVCHITVLQGFTGGQERLAGPVGRSSRQAEEEQAQESRTTRHEKNKRQRLLPSENFDCVSIGNELFLLLLLLAPLPSRFRRVSLGEVSGTVIELQVLLLQAGVD